MKAEILNKLSVIVELREDFSVEWGGKVFTVPKGYRCDGASIPDWVPNGFLNQMTGIRAAVVHDWNYDEEKNPDRLPKIEADELFNDMLDLDPEVSDLRRHIMVGAVNSDIGEEIYYGDKYVPKIVGQDEEVED